MEPKYTKEQKVKIISVKNQHGNLEYPKFQEHINETGIILDSLFMSIPGIGELEGEVGDQYFYKIRFDKTGTILEAVNEDALAALDE